MLSREDNEMLCRVGPGTPMGDLMRQYWIPCLPSSEFPEPDGEVKRMMLLGESFVMFRDSDGKIGATVEACPHRGASLYFGRNEECGLRCNYHGWKFDRTGAMVDCPTERPGSRAETTTSSGSTWARGRHRRRSPTTRSTCSRPRACPRRR
jgi:phthalate 4,5-dioxygenase